MIDIEAPESVLSISNGLQGNLQFNFRTLIREVCAVNCSKFQQFIDFRAYKMFYSYSFYAAAVVARRYNIFILEIYT